MDCRQAQPKLSQYIDSTLSARDTWEVDRHLAGCARCRQALAEMARTVEALQSAPRHEVSSDFAARLEARLAGAEPVPARRAWIAGLTSGFAPRRLPLWGLGAATCALAVVIVLANGSVEPTTAPVPVEMQAARLQSVALSASDPLQDLATANLAAASDSSLDPEGER